ncbi:MAG: diaminopimelate epimerase [Candidatus Tectomicrobia bacterium]|nr:diaminopimelate epimerase [Candidatus Tectomicrobia bacterium]
MRFIKMHGIGNDYIYLDCLTQPIPKDPPGLARRISDRHFGVGGDGLILILPSSQADFRMRMFNADGSEAQLCGNGVRCVAKYLHDEGYHAGERLRLETGAGIKELRLEVSAGLTRAVSVGMGRPILEPARIPVRLSGERIVDYPLPMNGQEMHVTCVSVGNPHCVVFVDDTATFPVAQVGPRIEHHPAFPERINVEFVQVLDRRTVRQRTWERGSGETLACGTGATAVCVASALTGRTERRITVKLLGGDLRLAWDEDDTLTMTGPAVEVFRGDWPEEPGEKASGAAA